MSDFPTQQDETDERFLHAVAAGERPTTLRDLPYTATSEKQENMSREYAISMARETDTAEHAPVTRVDEDGNDLSFASHLDWDARPQDMRAREVARQQEVDARLVESVTCGDPEAVEAALRDGANPDAIVNDQRDRCLHIAARGIHSHSYNSGAASAPDFTKVLLLLLEAGAAVRATNVNGKTPLHIATALNHGAETLALLIAGASNEMRDGNNQSPEDYAYKADDADHHDLAVYYQISRTHPELLPNLLAQYSYNGMGTGYVLDMDKRQQALEDAAYSVHPDLLLEGTTHVGRVVRQELVKD